MGTERISAMDILQAGLNTRSSLQLWTDVEDALTPKCEHSSHYTRPHNHGGEVHRLVGHEGHGCNPPREFYLCDGFWQRLVEGIECIHCGYEITAADYIILAEF